MATSDISFRDVNISFKKHPVTDDVVVAKDAAAIKQAIGNLLLTNRGERMFRPDYGSDLRRFLFEPMSPITAGQITQSVRYTISTFEPRVQLLTTETNPNYDDNGFDVEITYKILGSDIPPVAVEFFLSRTR